MFDAVLRPWIDPPLNVAGRWLAKQAVTADQVTIASFTAGMMAAVCVSRGWFSAALALIALNRLGDGLDGAIARATAPSVRGGFLDISLDFVVYASIPLAFAIYDVERNALPAAILLVSFCANGSTFLAYAIAADRQGLTTADQGAKSFYYVAGLAEGAETVAAFLLACLWPSAFPWIAGVFAGLCFISAIGRLVIGWSTLDRR
jgi:phosphatidylglycerophosphate synthase